MLYRSSSNRRRGAVMVESAIIYPLLFLLLFGLIVGGLGVFHYQQVACQAREAARWACVRGSRWQEETGQPFPTSDKIREQAVLPLAVAMDPNKLSVQVQWIDEITGVAVDWDSAKKWPTTVTGDGQVVASRVRVTVTYQWWPELFFTGPLNLQSVSEVPMAH